MNYREELHVSKPYKEAYLGGLNALISARQAELSEKRCEYFKDIFNTPRHYREDLRKMLGWPLVDHETGGMVSVRSEKLSEEDGYSIYRMHFEILDGFEMTGLYFRMNGEERLPLVLVQHGGLGTPELISGFYGSTANYNDMLGRVIKHGVHVFAPQLFLWDQEKYGVERNRQSIDAALKRVGSSITAVELYGMSRILDYFEMRDEVSCFGMVGLSYGGFYTLYMSALDERIKAAISCAYFNTRDFNRWSDWTWFNSAALFDDPEVACLTYPRRLWIEIAKNDTIFDCGAGERSFERLRNICREVGTDWVDLITFDGTHEFCRDDVPIEKMVEMLRKA